MLNNLKAPSIYKTVVKTNQMIIAEIALPKLLKFVVFFYTYYFHKTDIKTLLYSCDL